MTDVLLYATNDDGEINITADDVELTNRFDTAAYLSLFGANEDDDGSEGTPKGWWGNDGVDTADQYRSRTQYLLRNCLPIPANLGKLEDAAKLDLEWMLDGAASSIAVSASITAPKRVQFDITITAEGYANSFTYAANWEASQ